MRLTLISLSIITLFATAPASAGTDDLNTQRILTGAAGAGAGGLVGSQIGRGRGNTAAIAAGAGVGAVVASGCKPSATALLGGIVGGFLGSQVGNGTGSKFATAAGAAAGTLLGADCGAAGVADPVPVANKLLIIVNQARYTPVNGFPVAAFNGIPPIVSTRDFQSGADLVRTLATGAQDSLAKGDMGAAMVQTYWATRISDAISIILGNSLSAIDSAKDGRVTISGKAFVFLPSENASSTAYSMKTADASTEVFQPLAGLDLSNGVQVADLSLNSILGAVKSVNAATKPRGTLQTTSGDAGGLNGGQDRKIAANAQNLAELPVGQVLKTEDGFFVLRDATGFSIYNPKPTDGDIDLRRMNYIPTLFAPSVKWQAAADKIKQLNENRVEYFFRIVQDYGVLRTTVVQPNLYADSGMTIAYFDSNFVFGKSPSRDGETSYKTSPQFKLAVDANAVTSVFFLNSFFPMCTKNGSLVGFHTITGNNANLIVANCNQSKTRSAVVYSRTYYFDEDSLNTGKIGQTADSLLNDMRTKQTMKMAYAKSGAVSDMLGFVPYAGNVESAFQCFDAPTISQRAALAFQFSSANNADFYDKSKNAFVNSNVSDLRAQMAGWSPTNQGKDVMETTANCLGAIPLGSYAVKGISKLGKFIGSADILAQSRSIANLDKVMQLFESPLTPPVYKKGIQLAEELAPSSPLAAGFVKTVYDGLQTANNMTQFQDGLKDYRSIQ